MSDESADAAVSASATVDPVVLDLYKYAAEMADRVSARRAVANSFFLSVNAGFAALLGGQELRWYGPVAGIVFTVAWWSLLVSYRQLNGAKFQVINKLEEQLPVHLYTDEWLELKRMKGESRSFALWPPRAAREWLFSFHELGTIERIVPIVFALIYVAELIRQVTS
jgi:hypothetical protein